MRNEKKDGSLLLEDHVCKITFRRGVGVLRIYLKSHANHNGWFTIKKFSVVLVSISGLGNPLAGFHIS